MSELSLDQEIIEEECETDEEQIEQPLEEEEIPLEEEEMPLEEGEIQDNELFPDTAIHIHSKGGMGGVQYEFQRSISSTADVSTENSREEYFNTKVKMNLKLINRYTLQESKHRHMSAKERK